MMEGSSLIQGMFVSPEEQISLLREWNVQYGLGISEQAFDDLGEPPTQPTERLHAIVLDVGLKSEWRTLVTAWQIAAERQSYAWRDVRLDKWTVRLQGGVDHKPGLRWRVINFGANWSRTPRGGNFFSLHSISDSSKVPAAALVWAAAYFPEWIQKMDGQEVPFIWIPGYRVSDPDNEACWEFILRLYFYVADYGIVLDADHQDNGQHHWAVPEFVN